MTISPMCTTENDLPEPDCDNEARGVLIVVERQNGDMVHQRLICNPCSMKAISVWKMEEPDDSSLTLVYLSFNLLAEMEK